MEAILGPTMESAHAEDHYVMETERVCCQVGVKDFCFIPGQRLESLLTAHDPDALDDFEEFQQSWSRLVEDEYMADGGKYRMRRHATLSASRASPLFRVEPHQPHYQSLNYNPLNGGIARHYEPIEPAILHGKTLSSLIGLGCDLFGRLSPYSDWHIEVHQFRIDPRVEGVGKPTPEGVHRDGVNFVMMAMVQRINVVNGSTAIYDLEKRRLDEFTLTDPLDLAIANDERVFHGVTPIASFDAAQPAHRDVLVVTFRRKTR